MIITASGNWTATALLASINQTGSALEVSRRRIWPVVT